MKSIYRLITALALAFLLKAQFLNVAVSYTPPYVYPGSTLQLYITLTAAQPIADLHVAVDSPFKAAPSTFLIRQLAPTAPYVLTTTVQIPLNATPGLYPVRVVASTSQHVTEAATVVKVLPFDFSALAFARPAAYVAGEPAQLPILLFNPTSDYLKATVELRGGVVERFYNSTPSCAVVIPPRSNSTCLVYFVLPRHVKPGVYNATMSVSLLSMSGYAGAVSFNKTLQLTVVSGAGFGVFLSLNPPLAYPGGVVTGTLTVVAPYVAWDVDISIKTPLKLLSQRSFQLPVLAPGQPFTAYLALEIPREAAPGDYPVSVEINGLNYTFYVVVAEPAVVVQNVVVAPPAVLEGTPVAQAVVQVVNTGPVAARNVTVELLNSTLGSRRFSIDMLPPGASASFTYYLDTSKLRAGNYTVLAKAVWGGGQYVAGGTLEVVGKDRLEVGYKAFNVSPGSTALVVINVTNVGPTTAKNVKISLAPSQVFEPHTSNIVETASAGVRILGDIPPGGSATAVYLLDVSDKARPGTYPLTLVVVWNQTGVMTPALQYVTLPISVEGGLDPFVVVPAVVALVVVGVGVAVAVRRRRRG